MLKKLAKAAAISLAAVFVLALVVVGVIVGPPLVSGWQAIQAARADGTLRGQSWITALPPYAGKAFAATSTPSPVLGNTHHRGWAVATSQIAKNLLVKSSDRTIRRVIYEMVVCWELERVYTRDELITDYAQHVYLGRKAYGVDAGARAWFGKTTDKLTLGEAAFLSEVPRGPTMLEPAKNFDRAKSRRDRKLARMRELNFITQAEYDNAIAEPLVVIPAPPKP